MLQAKHKKKLDDLLAVCHKNLAKVNDDLITRAFEMSVEAHKHDLRSSGEPYFGHPFEVAMVVAKEIALDDVSVVSALLHDVVEDTDIDIEVIRKEFGDTIAEIVDGATKISNIFDSHEITQAENYRKLLLSMVNDIRVMIIKFADRLHNMRTLEYLPPEKQQRIAKETLDIYAPFAHRFGLAKIKWELEDLAFKHLHRKEYEEIAHGLNSKRREREHYIRKFIVPVETRLRQSNVKFEIEGRPKHRLRAFVGKRSQPCAIAAGHEEYPVVLLDGMQEFLVAEQTDQAALVIYDGNHQQVVFVHDGEYFLAVRRGWHRPGLPVHGPGNRLGQGHAMDQGPPDVAIGQCPEKHAVLVDHEGEPECTRVDYVKRLAQGGRWCNNNTAPVLFHHSSR